MPSLQRIAHNCPGLAVWASRGAVRASHKGPNTFSLASRFPKCCQTSISRAGCRPIPGCGSPSLCPEGHSHRLVIGLVGLGVSLLIGADLLLLIVACKILRFPASSGPFGPFYSIGGCSTVTLGPNGLFYQWSRGRMYTVPWVARRLDSLPGEAWSAVPPMERRSPPKNGSASAWARFLMGLGKRRRERSSRHLGVVGMAVGCAPGGGLVGHTPDGMPASQKKIMGSASAWARFLMGLGKQRRERRPRHLGVVSLAVGCAPGWGIVFIPSMECRADTMGSASAWARFFMGFGRRCREWLGVAIMFLALAPFATAAGPSRTKSSSPSSPLRTFSMDAAKGNPLLGGALGFPPVSAGSSCRAFVQSLVRAFIRAAVVLVASLAVGPAPPSEERFADAHVLVGACVVMLAVVSQLRRRCSGAVARTIAAVVVTLVAVA